MKINKPNLNTESIEDLVTDAQSGELSTATDPAELEAPTEVILNPIEADQAIEISNNNPKTEDLEGLTAYEQVNKIASETNTPLNKVLYVGDMMVDLNTSKNANVDIVYCNWGFGTVINETGIPKDIRVSSVDEIIEKILEK